MTDEERVVVSTPGYFKNLTEILKTEPKRNIANYMLWRVARASIGYLNKDARAVSEEFAKNITGKTATTPRWKLCVGAAAGSFSAAIGKMYVLKHFNHEAKDIMLEMVTDIREEFKTILDEVMHVFDANRSIFSSLTFGLVWCVLLHCYHRSHGWIPKPRTELTAN